jgi:TonB-dependent starch-binding outer membrane protein SusC
VEYYWSLGSAVNDHIVVNETYKNVRSRLNVSVNVTDYLEIGLNSHFSTDDDGDEPVNWERAIDVSPYGEKYRPDGTFKWYPHDDQMAQNPFENTEFELSNKTQTLMGNLSAKLKLPLGFEYRLNYSNRWLWKNNYEYRPTTTRSGNSSNGYARRQETNLYQ